MKRTNRTPLCFSDIMKYRSFLYGLAALWIFFLHIPYKIPKVGAWTILSCIQGFGACGVEMFVLMAGCGLYYSLKKHGIKTFYVRRALRVWLPVFLIYLVVCTFMEYSTLKTLGTLSVIGYWVKMPASWFAGFILLMYLVYPAFYWLLDNRRKLFCILCALAWPAALALLIVFEEELLPIKQGLTRIPVFMLGVAFTPAFLENRKLPRLIPAGFLIAGLAISAFASAHSFPLGIDYWVRTLSYTCISLCLIPLFTYLARFILKIRFGRALYKPVAFVGGISLEFYVLFVTVCKAMLLMPVNGSESDFLVKISFLSGAISIVLSVVVKWLCNLLVQEFSKTKLPE
ncbi:MAG: acyltransferase [Clostridia bacterium]|nr:acyltransferase [Clostridia bacterium]